MNYKAELYRKSFHLLSTTIPLAYFILSREQMIIGLSIATTLVVSIDIVRFYSTTIHTIFMKYFAVILRTHEKHTISGSTYLMIASLLVVIFFSREIAIISTLFAAICDTMAAVIGKRYGKIKIFSKSLEGSAAFFLSGVIIVFLLYREFILPGIIGAFITMVVELLPIKIDDNFLIPITAAISIHVSSILI